MVKKFILTRKNRKGENGILSDKVSASYLNQKEFILNKSKKFDIFFPKDTIFSPLIPKQIGGFTNNDSNGFINDFPGWIEKKPKGLYFLLSIKFRDLISNFKLPPFRIYKAEVLIKKELYPFSVLQLVSYYSKTLIDFENSTFCNFDFMTKEKLSDDHEKLVNLKTMGELMLEKKWSYVGFNKAVMKPEFERLDLVSTLHFGLLISERLKNAIESAGITGVEIKECPTEFEINYDLEQVVDENKPIEKIEVSSSTIQSARVTKATFPDGLRFKSQEDMDQFKVDYPHCTEIIGNVFIQGSVKNVDGLSQIERINGCFFVISCSSLENLEGLSKLSVLGGELRIGETRNLQSLNGLENLKEIQSNGLYYYSPEEQGISLDGNEGLMDLSALKNLKNTRYNLHIAYNPRLESLKGLEGFEKVGRYVVIQNNEQLEDISALSNLKVVNEKVIIVRNYSLSNLKGLENISKVGAINISGNAHKTAIKDLEGLKTYFQ